MAAKPASKGRTFSPRIENRRARHEYHVLETVEAGVALIGSEVKSIRLGEASLDGSYARIADGEAWLVGCHVKPYEHADPRRQPDPNRERKLLLHRRQIFTLVGSLSAKGTTLVPLALYFVRGRVKIELGLVRGKRQVDKRESIRKKEQQREMDQALRRRR